MACSPESLSAIPKFSISPVFLSSDIVFSRLLRLLSKAHIAVFRIPWPNAVAQPPYRFIRRLMIRILVAVIQIRVTVIVILCSVTAVLL